MNFALVDQHGAWYQCPAAAKGKGCRIPLVNCDTAVWRRQRPHHTSEVAARGSIGRIARLVDCDISSSPSIVKALEPTPETARRTAVWLGT